MGCGASAGGAAAPTQETPAVDPKLLAVKTAYATTVKVEKAGFTKCFSDADGKSGGGWLSDTHFAYICGDNDVAEHPVKVLDLSTWTSTEVGSITQTKEYAYPQLSTSPDGSLYAVACGNVVQVHKSSDHSVLTSITTPITSGGASNMTFSPDSSKLALEGDNQKCWVYSVADGTELLALEGEKASEYGMTPVWFDNDTLFNFHCWIMYANTVSKKEQICKWEIPEGRFVPTGVLITKSKKIYVANDQGDVHLLGIDEVEGKKQVSIKFTKKKMAEDIGPSNMQIFSDEVTTLFEQSGGGNLKVKTVADTDVTGPDVGEALTKLFSGTTLDRGDGGSISQVKMNSGESFLAMAGFDGLQVWAFAASKPEPKAAAAPPAAAAEVASETVQAAPVPEAPAEAPAEAAEAAEAAGDEAETPAAPPLEAAGAAEAAAEAGGAAEEPVPAAATDGPPPGAVALPL